MRTVKTLLVLGSFLSSALLFMQGGCSGGSGSGAEGDAAEGGDAGATYRCVGADLEYCAFFKPASTPAPSSSCGMATTCTKDTDCFPISCTCNGTATKVDNKCDGKCCLALADTCSSVCAGKGVPEAGVPPQTPPTTVDAGEVCGLWLKQETCATEIACQADAGRCTRCTTCAELEASCGTIDDGCGRTVACGPGCGEGTWCGGGGAPNKCGCTPGPRSGGPYVAGTGANDPSIGTEPWTSTKEITNASDGGASTGGLAEVSAMTQGQVSNWLVATSFKADVPSNATILGVEFLVTRKALSGFGIVDNGVRIVKGGVVQTADRVNPSKWTQSLSTVTYGGPTDLWGTTLTAADVRDVGFGLALSAKFTDTAGNDWPQVDVVAARVYFTVTCN